MKPGSLNSLLPHSRQIEEPHRLLLAAALLPPSEATRAWQAFRGTVDIQNMDRSSNGLASLLYCNLRQAGVDGPEMAILKGVYRYHWTRSSLATRTAAQIVNILTNLGFPVLLVHDFALASRFYGDPAARPASAITLFIPGGRAAKAAEDLCTRGWSGNKANWGVTTQYLLSGPDQFDVEIRDSLMFESAIPPSLLIENAVPFRLEAGTEVLGLDAADELIAALFRVVRSDGPPLMALADCATLILHPELDLERLIGRVSRFRLAWPLSLVCRELASIGIAPASSLLGAISKPDESMAAQLEFLLRARGKGRRAAHAADWLRARRAR